MTQSIIKRPGLCAETWKLCFFPAGLGLADFSTEEPLRSQRRGTFVPGGAMDIVSELTADHRALRDCVSELRSEATSPRQRSEILKNLEGWLRLHALGEAKTIDYYGKRRGALRVLAYEDVEEHEAVNALHAKLQRTRNPYLFAARLRLFCELLEHHLHEEEEEYFPLLERELSAEDRHQLALRYRAITEPLAPARPAPLPSRGRAEKEPESTLSESILL